MKGKIILSGTFATAMAVVLAIAVTAQGTDRTGAQTYADECAVCHGKFGEGQVGPPLHDLAPEDLQALPDIVRTGIAGKMPAFPPDQVSDAEIAATGAFLGTLPSPDGGREFIAAVNPVPAVPSTSDRIFFPQTGHTLSFGFKAFWEMNGGETRFGLPITEEFTDISPTDGKPYTMQLFERVRLERHPELAGTPFEIEEGLLGSENLFVRVFNRQDELETQPEP